MSHSHAYNHTEYESDTHNDILIHNQCWIWKSNSNWIFNL